MIKPQEVRDKTMMVRLTTAEHKKIKARAKRHKVSMSAFLRWLGQETK